MLAVFSFGLKTRYFLFHLTDEKVVSRSRSQVEVHKIAVLMSLPHR